MLVRAYSDHKTHRTESTLSICRSLGCGKTDFSSSCVFIAVVVVVYREKISNTLPDDEHVPGGLEASYPTGEW